MPGTRLRSLVVSAVLSTALLIVLPQLLNAQNITGTILGSVTDASGALIPGAEVTATNQQTSEFTKSTTGGLGTYEVPYLKPGVYRIEVTTRQRDRDGETCGRSYAGRRTPAAM